MTLPLWGCNAGENYLNIEIELDEAMMDRLLLCAAETELSVEEIIITAIQNYLERGGNHAD